MNSFYAFIVSSGLVVAARDLPAPAGFAEGSRQQEAVSPSQFRSLSRLLQQASDAFHLRLKYGKYVAGKNTAVKQTAARSRTMMQEGNVPRHSMTLSGNVPSFIPSSRRMAVEGSMIAALAAVIDQANKIRVEKHAHFKDLDTILARSSAGEVIPDSTKASTPSVKGHNIDALLKNISTAGRAIYLGEHHYSDHDHRLQAALIRRIHALRSNMVVGVEFVQQKFQVDLDNYIAGKLPEKALRQSLEWDSRWAWPFESYLPVFQACRELGVRMLALNVDSEDLDAVKTGGMPALPRERLMQYIPDGRGFAKFSSTRAFKEYVQSHMRPSYDMHRQMGILRTSTNQEMPFINFYSGQVLWDEAMASVAAKHLRTNPDSLLVGIVGTKHTQFGCGVPARTARQLPGGLQSVTSVLLNPKPADTVVGGQPGLVEQDQNYVLQFNFCDDECPEGTKPEDVSMVQQAMAQHKEEAAAVMQTRAGSSVLTLADYVIFGGAPTEHQTDGWITAVASGKPLQVSSRQTGPFPA